MCRHERRYLAPKPLRPGRPGHVPRVDGSRGALTRALTTSQAKTFLPARIVHELATDHSPEIAEFPEMPYIQTERTSHAFHCYRGPSLEELRRISGRCRARARNHYQERPSAHGADGL